MIIAIDGPSGTGKGTVARRLADRLGIIYFDTGAMYRALTYLCLKVEVAIEPSPALEKLLDTFDFRVERGNGSPRYWIGSEEVTESIRTERVEKQVSALAALPIVREKLVETQRALGSTQDAIFEGRDIGTVVFPNAELKIFLTARPRVRAERRFRELIQRGEKTTVEEVEEAIERRDRLDSTREHSPLAQAEDAYLVDTSDLTIDEVVDCVMDRVRSLI